MRDNYRVFATSLNELFKDRTVKRISEHACMQTNTLNQRQYIALVIHLHPLLSDGGLHKTICKLQLLFPCISYFHCADCLPATAGQTKKDEAAQHYRRLCVNSLPLTSYFLTRSSSRATSMASSSPNLALSPNTFWSCPARSSSCSHSRLLLP